MRELWSYIYPPLETGRQRTLPLQRLRTLLQDERTESATYQAKTEIGKHLATFHAKSNDFQQKRGDKIFRIAYLILTPPLME